MPLNIVTDPNPLRVDDGGAVRVGKSRVLFEMVVNEFQRGQTPEQIVQSFDTLQLADVYAAIAYYLRHRPEVEEWLRENDAQAQAIRTMIESSQPQMIGMRERLLARRRAQEQEHASTTQ